MKKYFEKFKKLFHRRNVSSDVTQYRDWSILASVFVVVLGIVAIASYMLFQYFENSIDTTTTTTPAHTINRTELLRVVGVYDAKRSQEESLLRQRPTVNDPGL